MQIHVVVTDRRGLSSLRKPIIELTNLGNMIAVYQAWHLKNVKAGVRPLVRFTNAIHFKFHLEIKSMAVRIEIGSIFHSKFQDTIATI